MAGAWESLLKGLKGLRAGKRQARTSLKTDGWGTWLRELLPVALANSWKGLRKRLKRLKDLNGLRAGKRQARTPLKTDGYRTWLRELLPVALERPAEVFEQFEGFQGGQTAGSNVLKNRWLEHVAARVVASCLGKFLERLAEVFEAFEAFEGFEGFEWFEGRQAAGSNTLKNRWLSHVAARVVASCIGKAGGNFWGVWKVSGRAVGRLELP